MKARFACEPNPDGERLRAETEAAFRRADTERIVLRVSIATSGTTVAHGFDGVPRWRVFNQEGPGDVYQTAFPDRQFLYLEATPADVVVSLELF